MLFPMCFVFAQTISQSVSSSLLSESLMAIRTPPPDDALSFLNMLNPLGKISESCAKHTMSGFILPRTLE